MKISKLRTVATLLLCMALIISQAAVSFAVDEDSADAKQCWTLGLSKNVNGPEDGVQGTNGWYFMYTDQIDLGAGNVFDASKIKECTWATKGSMKLKSEGGEYDAMWVPENYLADGLTGEALYQPNGDNPDGTFNNWVMTSDGTLNTDVETTAVTGIYAWEAPEAGDYSYELAYNAGGNHCDLWGSRYYYYKDYYIQDGTPSKRTPKQREGGVAVSVNTADAQKDYVECIAMTEDHDYLYSGNFSGKVTLEKGEKIYFAVDPREVGPYDMANLKITVTTGDDCVWATGEGAVTYEWDDNNNCTAYRKCTTHNGHLAAVTAEGVLVESVKEPTCSEDGEGVFKAEFTEDGLEDQTANRPIASLEHQYDAWNNINWDEPYGDKTKIEFSPDYSKVTWYTKCDNCDEWIFIEEAATTSKPAPGSAADCTHGGEAIFEAGLYWGWFPVSSEPVEVGPLGHDDSEAYNNAYAENSEELTQYIWSADNSKCTWKTKCSRCDEFLDIETVNASVGTVPATCTEKGAKVAKASFWGGWVGTEKTVEEIDALGHDDSKAFDNFWAEENSDTTELVWNDDNSKCTWRTKCERCGEFFDVETAVSSSEETAKPDCTHEGTITYTAGFWGGWAVTSKEVTEPALGHKWSEWTTVDGKTSRTCSVCNEVQEAVEATPVVTLSKTAYVYNGKVQKPAVTVKVNGEKLADTEYTVTYATGCKNVGKYSVNIKLKNAYIGSKAVSFKIIPKATTLKSVAKGKKAFTAKWTKKTVQTTGYQIQYSTSSTFKSAKIKTITKNGTTSATVKKLKGGKKYYVRVRTYKTVNGVKYFSAWSAKKSVVTKK